MASADAIERQTVCRRGFIGSLYDIRTDKLEGTNLFKKKLPEEFIDVSDNAHTSYELLFNNSQKETFDKMNIEASLKLSLMTGILDIAGSAKYLKETKTNSLTIRVTYVYKVKTKQEQLHISRDGLSDYCSVDALKNPNATHVVTGIIWGANVAATFEQEAENLEEVQKVEGSLSAVLKSLPISGEAKLDLQNTDKSKVEKLQISLSGDILIDECPQNIEGVMRVFKTVPSRIKTLNEGKGQQLVFVLHPLKKMAEIFKPDLKINTMIEEVSHLVVMRIEDIFEDISIGKRKFNDFFNEIKPWEHYISRDWRHAIRQKQAERIAAEVKTQRELSTLLQKIRGGQAEESEMERLLDDFDRKNPCSSMSIERLLREKQNVTLKIRLLKDFQPEKHLLKEITSIKYILSRLYDKNVYLLHVSEEWETKDGDNSFKQLRLFKSMIKNETIDSAFIVIDYDLHHSDLKNDEDKANKCCIYHAIHGKIKSKDYYQDSLKKLSRSQISSILKENSSLSEKDILQRHKDFLIEYPTGELTDDEFVGELQKLYKDGNSSHYCDYIFAAIDKDRSGTISFSELMSAVALTSIGNADNVEKRLSLIFQIIDSNEKNGINFQQLVKFIEVVTELVKGEAAVNTTNIKVIVKQMFEMFKKNVEDEQLSKEEFMKCCTQKYKEIGCSFLPDIPVNIPTNATWKQNGVTIAGGHGQGDATNQPCTPHGLFVDDDQTVVIADYGNHRIMQWKNGDTTNGQRVAGDKDEGNGLHQLGYPTDVLIDKETDSLIICDRGNQRVVRWPRRSGTTQGEILIDNIECYGLAMDEQRHLYVSDYRKHEVRRYQLGEKNDTLVAGGNDEGGGPNQLDEPGYLFVDRQQNVYVSDHWNRRVMKWPKGAKEGIVVAGDNDQRSAPTQLSFPNGIFVDTLGTLYVADSRSDRVMRWTQGAKDGTVIVGGNGRGEEANQLSNPDGLSFDRHGNLYVADCGNNRVQRFSIE
ncbi:unnamed protein product [Rotaria socialis]